MIKWSFSSLKDFVNCPKQYYEVKIKQNYTKKVTEQMLYGSAVHKAIEDYTKDGAPLAKNYQRFKDMVDPLLEIDGEKYPERKMALTKEKAPCDFDDENYWVRGIVDYLAISGDTAFIVDYKTGSARYPDPKQLKLMALMTFAHHPEVVSIKAGLLFVMHNVFIDESYTRDDIDKLWMAFDPDLKRLQFALDNDKWIARPSGLCGWCPVSSCEFHKER